ncbi:hypothetical protein HYV43_07150 [Candidatus Micrarchaeota archaeon]|nr:hypothetical protein [Candidatus Micrarchaeota archaeon]
MPIEAMYSRGGLSKSLRAAHASVLNDIFAGNATFQSVNRRGDRYNRALVELCNRGIVDVPSDMVESKPGSAHFFVQSGWAAHAADFLNKEKPIGPKRK